MKVEGYNEAASKEPGCEVVVVCDTICFVARLSCYLT